MKTAWLVGQKVGHFLAVLFLSSLVLAALLLTPAYPGPGVTTLAPALVVAGFQLMTEGLEAARHAVRPLLFVLAIGFFISLLLQILVFRKRGRARRGVSTPYSPDT